MEKPTSSKEKRSSAAPGWRGAVDALLYLGVYFVAQFLAALLFAGATLFRLLSASPGLDPADLVRAVLSALQNEAVSLSLFSNLLTLPALYLTIRLKKQPVSEALALRPVSFQRLWPLLPLGAALNGFVTTLLSLLPSRLLSGYAEASGILLSETGLLPLVTVAFLGPITEEIVFRGLLFQNLAKSVPPFLAALLTSALFGALHGQIVWMGYAFCIGLVFCLIFRRYGSLWAVLALHVCFNLSGGFAAALSLLPTAPALAVSLAATAIFLSLACQKSKLPNET